MKLGLQPIVAEPVAPSEAIEFFRSKGLAPADQRFDYRDYWRAQHARGFVVAKAMEGDVLKTIRAAVDRALAEGRTLAQFREELEPELRRLGWWGVQDRVDPVTGSWERVRLGSPNRLRVIFDTNLKTSWAAGRWMRIQRTKRTFPYLRYQQIQRPTKRETHEPYHDLILPVDHPLWLSIFPPNGYLCGCIVRQLSESAMRRQGLSVTRNPPTATERVENRRTGVVEEVPAGVTPGFDTNPGSLWRDVRDGHGQVARGLDREAAAAELGAILEVRDRGIRDRRESMALIDAETAEIVDWELGDEDSVGMTPRMIEAAADQDRETVLVHNHPGGESFTLSAPDFEVLRTFPGLDRIVAVGHSGSIYVARKTSPGLNIGGRRVSPDGVARFAFQLVGALADRGVVDRAELAEVHSFVVARSLHEAGVIDYSHHLKLRARQLYERNRQVIQYLAEMIGARLRDGNR